MHAGSWFNEFLHVNRENLGMIVPCPGDLSRMNWGANPIEILMIDASKAWFLNRWIVGKMFPRLIPGISVVIQQDYCHFVEYWCALTMEYYADFFMPLDFVYGASGVFLNVKSITELQAAFDIETLPHAEKQRLMESAIAKAPPSAAEVLKTAYAKMMIDLGDPFEARKIIDSVNTSKLTEDSIDDFSAIAKSCVVSVNRILAAA